LSNRAAVFIDNAYFSKILKNNFGQPRIDYKLFSDTICGSGCERMRTYLYDCMPYQSTVPTPDESLRYSKMDSFMSHLRKLPRFEVRLGSIQKIWVNKNYTYKQKMIDTLLSIDMVKLSSTRQIQDAILVAGDHDFVPAVKASKEAGVVIKLYYAKPIHDELFEACDEKIEITSELIDKVKI
jgi:uncharacterized LabA/DUF88 family protein